MEKQSDSAEHRLTVLGRWGVRSLIGTLEHTWLVCAVSAAYGELEEVLE